jgi:hypothetical protein
MFRKECKLGGACVALVIQQVKFPFCCCWCWEKPIWHVRSGLVVISLTSSCSVGVQWQSLNFFNNLGAAAVLPVFFSSTCFPSSFQLWA